MGIYLYISLSIWLISQVVIVVCLWWDREKFCQTCSDTKLEELSSLLSQLGNFYEELSLLPIGLVLPVAVIGGFIVESYYAKKELNKRSYEKL